MIMTLCDRCSQPFYDDRNYCIRIVRGECLSEPKERGDGECFICGRRGCDYDIDKVSNIKK